MNSLSWTTAMGIGLRCRSGRVWSGAISRTAIRSYKSVVSPKSLTEPDSTESVCSRTEYTGETMPKQCRTVFHLGRSPGFGLFLLPGGRPSRFGPALPARRSMTLIASLMFPNSWRSAASMRSVFTAYLLRELAPFIYLTRQYGTAAPRDPG
jgi:hypothetical protein